MSRIDNIITRVRDTLADPSGDRWSDDRLIRLIDEAQKDLVRRAKLLRSKALIPIFSYGSVINLPTDMLLLDKVIYGGVDIPFISHREADKIDRNWESATGTPQYVVYDKQNKYKAKFYPVPIDIGPIDIVINDFGVITEFPGIDFQSTAGVMTDLFPYNIVDMNGDYGVTTDLIGSYAAVIYYLKKPSDIISLTDTLEIDDVYDKAIKFYVSGRALRDDMDTQNRAFGNEELKFYERELKEAISDDTNDYTRNTHYHTSYTGGI